MIVWIAWWNMMISIVLVLSKTEQNPFIFIIDSGLDISHPTFLNDNLILLGPSFVQDGNSLQDSNGHGTYIASIVRSVSKNNNIIIPIRCIGSGGMASMKYQIIKGIQWFVKYITLNKISKSILLLSISPKVSGSYTRFIKSVLKETDDVKNLVVVVASGNHNSSICNEKFPLNLISRVIIVGAATQSHHIADFSNFGKCISVFANGENIHGSITLNTSHRTEGYGSGTSPAAGYVGRVWSKNCNMSSSDIYNLVIRKYTMRNILKPPLHQTNQIDFFRVTQTVNLYLDVNGGIMN